MKEAQKVISLVSKQAPPKYYMLHRLGTHPTLGITTVGLFYIKRSRNHIHCSFLFTCLCSCFLRAFFHTYRIRIISKQIYLIHRWDLSRFTPGQSEPGSNANKRGTAHCPALQNWSLTTRCCSVLYRGYPFLGRFLLLNRRYSSRILSHTDSWSVSD